MQRRRALLLHLVVVAGACTGAEDEAVDPARIVPLIEEGRQRGFKLYGLRPGSLGALLGLQNGDALVSIDGRPLDSVESALERYSSLRGAKRVELGYERRGEARALTLVLD